MPIYKIKYLIWILAKYLTTFDQNLYLTLSEPRAPSPNLRNSWPHLSIGMIWRDDVNLTCYNTHHLNRLLLDETYAIERNRSASTKNPNLTIGEAEKYLIFNVNLIKRAYFQFTPIQTVWTTLLLCYTDQYVCHFHSTNRWIHDCLVRYQSVVQLVLALNSSLDQYPTKWPPLV